MTYRREIPRDLFNEANLLKCYGKIFINLETADAPAAALEHDGGAFRVVLDEGSGELSIANVILRVRGDACRLFRAHNSWEAWPLYMRDQEDEEIPVFADDGSFSPEMLDFLRGPDYVPSITKRRP